jgi:hypothetical protein
MSFAAAVKGFRRGCPHKATIDHWSGNAVVATLEALQKLGPLQPAQANE